jgi:hypothetical protein
VRFGAAQNAENVVLCAGKASGFDDLFGLLSEEIGAFEDGDEEPILEGDGRGMRP